MGMKGGKMMFEDGVGVGSLTGGDGGDDDDVVGVGDGDGGGVVMIDGRLLTSERLREENRRIFPFRCD